jgi:C-terminal processing protease CtpA/Prc
LAREKEKALRPDKEKLAILAETIGEIKIPEMKEDETANVAEDVKNALNDIIDFITNAI